MATFEREEGSISIILDGRGVIGARGQARGKAAEKLTDTAEMVRIARDPNDNSNPALG